MRLKGLRHPAQYRVAAGTRVSRTPGNEGLALLYELEARDLGLGALAIVRRPWSVVRCESLGAGGLRSVTLNS